MIQAPERETTEKDQAQKEANAKASPHLSYVLWAVAAIFLLDLVARVTYPLWPIDHYNSPNRSYVWWAADDFHRQPNAPDIVLLGSSLMMAAVHGGDATYLNAPQDVTRHHYSAYLESLLKTKAHKKVSTFSFAIGGQMASDAYVITRALCQGDKRPDTIIFGIAPRDFMDNCLANPASTETFRYMSRVANLSDLAVSARTSLWDVIDYGLGKICFLYAHRLDLIYLEQNCLKQILSSWLGYEDLESVHTSFYLRQIALLNLPEDTGPGEVLVQSHNKYPQPYQDNLKEYESRYRQFNKKVFKQQVGYLDQLLQVCKDRHIKMILVNMPLTEANVSIMPPGFYKNYLDTVSQASTKYGATLLDLNNPKLFPKICFADTVHLNGMGGMRFFEVLSDRLSDQQLLQRR